MSKRRKIGDLVWKRENAGFCGVAGRGVIPYGSMPEPCFICDDPECQEWTDVLPCDCDGAPTGGNWCHVSECQMSDAPDGDSK